MKRTFRVTLELNAEEFARLEVLALHAGDVTYGKTLRRALTLLWKERHPGFGAGRSLCQATSLAGKRCELTHGHTTYHRSFHYSGAGKTRVCQVDSWPTRTHKITK